MGLIPKPWLHTAAMLCVVIGGFTVPSLAQAALSAEAVRNAALSCRKQLPPAQRADAAALLAQIDATDPPALMIDAILMFGECLFDAGQADIALPLLKGVRPFVNASADPTRLASFDMLEQSIAYYVSADSTDMAKSRDAYNRLALDRQSDAFQWRGVWFAERLRSEGLNGEAISVLREVMASLRGDEASQLTEQVAYQVRASIMRSLGNYEDAHADLKKAIALEQKNGSVRVRALHALLRSELFMAQGQRHEALLQSYEAMQLRAQGGTALDVFSTGNDLSYMLMQVDRPDAARAVCEATAPLIALIDDVDEKRSYYVTYAQALARTAQATAARKAFDTALSIGTPGIKAHSTYELGTHADVLLAEGKMQAGTTALHRAMRAAHDRSARAAVAQYSAIRELYEVETMSARRLVLEQKNQLAALQLANAERTLTTQRLVLGAGACGIGALAGLAMWQVSRLRRERQRSRFDALTGTLSRGNIESRALRDLRNHDTAGKAYSLLVLDMDGLKQLNDRHGHAAGDEALRQMAAAASRVLRPDDSIGRWGGDEFVVSLPNAGADEARAIGERIRMAIDNVAPQVAPDDVRWSVSVGATTVSGNALNKLSLADVVAQADAALYAAKSQGRNRVQQSGDVHAAD